MSLYKINDVNEIRNFVNGLRRLDMIGYTPDTLSNLYKNAYTDISYLYDRNEEIRSIDYNDLTYAQNMTGTYKSCYNLAGSPMCGPNVVDMTEAYYCCTNLTGNAVCGPNVVDMTEAYYCCNNLTGNAVCGPNVVDMGYAYYCCTNLTSIYSEDFKNSELINLPFAFNGCSNIGYINLYLNSATNLCRTFYTCHNLYGDIYLNYRGTDPNDIDGSSMFGVAYNYNSLPKLMKNIHVPKGYAWDNWLFNNKLVANSYLEWTVMTNGYYNTAYNIYVYNNL